MTKTRQWTMLTGVVVLAVLAAGWLMLVSPKRAQATELQAQTEAQVSAAATLRTKLALLQQQAADLPAQRARLAAVQSKIPDSPALPALIRALNAASTASGVEFVSLVPGSPTPVAVGTPTAPAAAEPGTAAGEEPAAGAPAADPAGTLTAIPVTITVYGGFYEAEQYLAALEDLPRAFRVIGLSLAPGANPVASPLAGSGSGSTATDGSRLVTTITGQVYLAPDRSPDVPVVAPGAPSSVAAPAVTPN